MRHYRLRIIPHDEVDGVSAGKPVALHKFEITEGGYFKHQCLMQEPPMWAFLSLLLTIRNDPS